MWNINVSSWSVIKTHARAHTFAMAVDCCDHCFAISSNYYYVNFSIISILWARAYGALHTVCNLVFHCWLNSHKNWCMSQSGKIANNYDNFIYLGCNARTEYLCIAVFRATETLAVSEWVSEWYWRFHHLSQDMRAHSVLNEMVVLVVTHRSIQNIEVDSNSAAVITESTHKH